MIPLQFNGIRRLLCLGAHADDIEIGCGGAVLRLLAEQPGLQVCWIVLSADAGRAAEARASADPYLQHATERRVDVMSFRDSYFPYEGPAIKEYLHALGREISPDLVLTHRRDDLHQDHRLTAELTWNVFRNHLIWEYEIPKYDGDLGRPNFYVSLDTATCERKVQLLLEAFPSQRVKPWFTRDTFLALMRLRGVESNSPSGFAEGFHCHKAVF